MILKGASLAGFWEGKPSTDRQREEQCRDWGWERAWPEPGAGVGVAELSRARGGAVGDEVRGGVRSGQDLAGALTERRSQRRV